MRSSGCVDAETKKHEKVGSAIVRARKPAVAV
jgi:hypothetical protein